MASVPTIKILADTAKGYRIINASDFDPARHVPVDVAPEYVATVQTPRKRGRPPKHRSVNHGA